MTFCVAVAVTGQHLIALLCSVVAVIFSNFSVGLLFIFQIKINSLGLTPLVSKVLTLFFNFHVSMFLQWPQAR